MILLLANVQAAAFYTANPGARAMGRGGAYIVGNHDISAQYYNPAALRNIQGGHAKFDLGLVGQTVSFTRDGYDPVENSGAMYKVPSLGVAWGGERATVAFGLYSPYAPAFLYPEDGPQRYSMIDSTLIQTSVGPSASFDVLPWLTLGGGIAWMTNTVGREVVLTTSGGDEPAGDIALDLLVTDWFGVGGQVAASVHPTDLWEVAVSVQLPSRFDGKGSLEADFSDNGFYSSGVILDPIAGDDEVTLDIKMPLILRGGVVLRPNEKLELELSGDYGHWSGFDEIVVTDVDIVVDVDNTNPLFPEDPAITDDVTLPSTYQDSWSVRLGGEYGVHERLDVRAGLIYESSAVPLEIMTVDLVDGNKFGGGVGVTPHIGPVSVDVGVFAMKLADQTITNSQVHQVKIEVLDGKVTEGDVVGNGSYESLIYTAAVGLEYRFGQR